MNESRLPFSDMILEAMRRKGMGLRALCRMARLDPSLLSKILQGKRSPPAKESILKTLAEALGLDPELLIVCAGRIPIAWEALWRDPELFDRVDSLARKKRTLPSAKGVSRHPGIAFRQTGENRSPVFQTVSSLASGAGHAADRPLRNADRRLRSGGISDELL